MTIGSANGAEVIYEDPVVVMPAGEYWVGDPCYVIGDHEEWMEWLEAADYVNERRFLLAELRGKAVLGVGTAYGDGCYFDQDHREYPVDAGLIGLTPVEFFEGGTPFGCHKMEFMMPFTVSYSEGFIHIGRLRIDTN